ncbi:hypothetical protein AWL63_15165 [Sphingomonas panacis]|uniref:Uncharacterized protein n=1 Tax=Sphingomonas panacis TaxID=1560345 RepID=A0A1B3ZCE5_9SPHN|nr:hypothetical protein [Sphingomonas panacis]AOH85096.1 hypothetical protein AWL63_15165 [Sphingomonas panacis]
MTGDVLFYVVMLVLPISALVARRLPVGEVVKMALAWLAIFLLLFCVVAAWQEAMGVGAGMRGSLGL